MKASSPLLLTSFRLHARGRSVKCDFLTAAGRALVFDLLKSGRVCYVHMAPPCSTASAARNISGGPTPLLRNAAFPDGLPSLEFAQRVRVSQANRLYAFCCEVAQVCQGQGVYWSVENPASSVFWATSAMQSLCHRV